MLVLLSLLFAGHGQLVNLSSGCYGIILMHLFRS